jgi:hypothetical protein
MVGASFTVAAVAQVLRSKKGITAVGNAQVDTAQSKFGGASALFDGTGDYLDATSFSQSAGDTFTFECWVRFAATPSSGTLAMLISSSSSSNRYLALNNVSGTLNWEIGHEGTAGTFYRRWTATVSTNTWYHVALTKNGTTGRLFVNGTLLTPAQDFGTLDATEGIFSETMRLGAWYNTGNALNGHMDEIRISDIERYTTTFTPSTSAFVNDANTVLLIHANGTDGSTFFEDDNGVRASRSLIAQGNAQIDTAQSKFGGSALLCDGTGDYLLSPAGSHFDFGTGDFTIEYFIRFNAINTLYVPIALRPGAGIGNGEWWCEIQAGDNRMYWGFKNQAGTTFYANFPVIGTAMTTGSFHHIALVKSGSTLTQYLNGTANGNVGTGLSGSFGNSGSDLWIGAGAGAYSVNGWMDEVRISNTARYTTTFTPSTTPFVNDANTLLLVHADGTDASTVFRDDNGTLANRQPNYITALGNAQVSTAQSKFGGASALFDGTGDYLSLGANSVTNDLALTSTTWTVEYWARITSHMGAFQATVAIWNDVNGVGNVYYFSTNIYNGTNKMGFQYNYGTNSDSGALAFGSVLSTGVWQHHAFVRNGNTLTAYLDGVSQGTHDMTGRTIDITGYNNSGANSVPVTIGGMSTGSGSFNGYLDEVRISTTARYTAAFTPSTIPFTNDANTVLLIHANGTNASTAFNDDTGNRTQVGINTDGTGAAVSTTQSKFGGSSLRLSFSGSTWDYLQITQPSSLLNFGTGDWTVEGWFRFDDTNTDLAIWTGGTTTGDLDIRRLNDNTLRIGRVNTAWDVTSGSTGISANTWYHIAFVKGSGTARIYVDGTQVGTASNSISYSIATQLRIGAQSTSSLGMSGYIDELRASNIARYTAAFTAPTAPFQSDANTLLLLHMDGTNASTAFFDDNGIAPYTP